MEPFNDTDTISRQAAIDTLCTICELYGYCDGGDGDDPCDDVKALKHLPSAQAIEPERKKGKWIRENVVLTSNPPQYKWHCSECGRMVHWFTSAVLTDYCPSCGADMRGDSDG